VTDTYDYDAWGNTVNSTGSTSNVYLYRGEQYDADLGLYYLTARYLNPLTGRFLSRDPDSGRIAIPATLHKYLYAGGDPVNRWDPSGAKLSETLLLIGITLEVMGPRVFYSAMYYGSQFLNEVQWSGLDAASVFCSVLTDMNFAWFVLSGFKQIGPPWEPAPLKGMCMAAAIGSR